MGHHISAIVIPGDIDTDQAAQFDAKIVPLRKGFVAIALCGEYIDAWADRLDIHDDVAAMPLCDSRVVRHIATTLAGDRPFALIETDYFGGTGTQWAGAYNGDTELMPVSAPECYPSAGLFVMRYRAFMRQNSRYQVASKRRSQTA